MVLRNVRGDSTVNLTIGKSASNGNVTESSSEEENEDIHSTQITPG